MEEIARVKKARQGEIVKTDLMMCRNPAHGHRPDAKAVPVLNYMKLLPQEEASKIFLQEIKFIDHDNYGVFSLAAKMSDG